MKVNFVINGTFEFDFSDKRQLELIEDGKSYPGGIVALLLDNLQMAAEEEYEERKLTINSAQLHAMIDTLMKKENKNINNDSH